jgi:hypothetical protein
MHEPSLPRCTLLPAAVHNATWTDIAACSSNLHRIAVPCVASRLHSVLFLPLPSPLLSRPVCTYSTVQYAGLKVLCTAYISRLLIPLPTLILFRTDAMLAHSLFPPKEKMIFLFYVRWQACENATQSPSYFRINALEVY